MFIPPIGQDRTHDQLVMCPVLVSERSGKKLRGEGMDGHVNYITLWALGPIQ